jgi:hypothetical protein
MSIEPSTLIKLAAQVGVTLRIEGKELWVRGPKGMRDAWLPVIRQCKPVLIAILEK